MIIDFHTHAFPDTVAEKAIPKLAGIGGIEPYGNGTVGSLISRMDEWGIDRSVVLNIATNGKQQTNVNNFAIETNKSNPRLYALGSLNPDSENIAGEAKRLRDNGIRGIKIHPDYMGVEVDDSKFDPIYKAAIDNGLFVVTHSGWDFISPNHIHCTPKKIANVLDRFPSLIMVAAHMGAYRMWDEVASELLGRDNLYIETSLAPMDGLDKTVFARMLNSHSPDRILFGSDFPWYSAGMAYSYVDSLGISSELKEKLFSKNAISLLGEK